MRAGACTVQQALTPEATTVVKQAVALARRRGHAQVTPLHVAHTMLTTSTGLLRTACLQSHSHPLQCKALELCFNVALNRLPASTSSSILGSHHHLQQHYPSISNALVAAFKRAQAHQRRGSIENQQQPLLAVKIELEQLIISILDDPSVSRVMREAGFSSTQVKSNVQQAVSLEICNNSSPSITSKPKVNLHHPHHGQVITASKSSKPMALDSIRNDDVESLIDELTKRRNIVVVGESISSIQSVVKEATDMLTHRGNININIPEGLRDVKFITLPSYITYGGLSRLEVEQKLDEIKGVIKSYMSTNGVVLNLGDIKWAIESRASSSGSNEHGIMRGYGNYCPIQHIIMELGELGHGLIGSECHKKLWLMGFATFQTYIKCKIGHPSLETLWGLHSHTLPADSLRLTLITNNSDLKSESTSNKAENGNGLYEESREEDRKQQQLSCCVECASKFENEVRILQSSTTPTSTSKLPPWLQQVKNERIAILPHTHQESNVTIKDLCRKWNSICNTSHKKSPFCSEKTLTFASISPSSSTSTYSQRNHYPNLLQDWPILSNPSTAPNSTSSSDIMEMDYSQRLKDLNAENLKTLCNALEYMVPWQKDIIPEIASTILQCRSGKLMRKNKRKGGLIDQVKEETWLLFQGLDLDAKEKIAKELAKTVFGSYTSFVSIALSSFSSSSVDDCRNKRSRDEQSCSYIERFVDVVSSNPHRVFFVEDVDQADYCSQIRFRRAIESGRVTNASGEEVGLSDAIIILSCESFSSRSRACSPSKRKIEEESETQGTSTSPCLSNLDLNATFDDDDSEEDQNGASMDEIGLVESVDRRINFKIQ